MCWADKIGVTWAFLVYFALFALSNDKGAAVTWFFSFDGLKLLLIVIAPIWLILRLIDWIGGGPQRRRGAIKARLVSR